ncbi:MAG: S41 family peptidase [Clostridiales bacterium]|nr:S41 family peptidase [Candidatus Crickella caballi]
MKNQNSKIKIFIAGFVCCAVLLLLLTKVFHVGALLVGSEYRTYKGLDKDYGKYYEILELIDEEALAEYEPDKITDDVLKELVEGLDDPYAEYFTAEEYELYMKHYKESYVGVGLAVADYEDWILVYKVIEGSPAAEAGIDTGDIVTKIDGKKVKDSTEASEALSGKVGEEVTITVKRGDNEYDYTMDRAKIDDPSVGWKEYDKDKGIAYIEITAFKEGTSKELRLAIKELKNEGYTKAIIDLRDNGGGRTKEAYKVADMLLPEGKIDTEVNKNGKEVVNKSKPSDAGIDYVVLVNENTASASELVSAAIQDNKGGKIIGVTTYGKGVTQRTHKFSDGSAIKFTIEEYFRPNGDKVNGVGVTPDIVLAEDVMADNDAVLKLAADELK